MIEIRDSVEIPIGRSPHRAPTFVTFSGLQDNLEHFAVVFKSSSDDYAPKVRIHSECITGDLFHSERCDCGNQLGFAIDMLNESGGVLLYLRQEGRGIGLYEKLSAYKLQDNGIDTFSANRLLGHKDDGRDFTFVPSMLSALGVSKIRLITNNPAKISVFSGSEVSLVEIINTPTFLNQNNIRYLTAKQKHGHNITIR
ncbi:GTP cyclohydrolase-2 [Agrobacterium vitis]|uniref:GTP cyclohydrolase II RibA n=1 Tax=Agrobacterium vitis TaxID=373 RepID=UPI0015D69C54|nr:GTP cyclohydrolase II RibA [Agrobacterium vitis]BCH60799.1 GTP cyclohydrolase-2 [Agrobacterium vitis]